MKTDDLERELKDLFTEMVSDEPPLAAPMQARASTWTFSARSLFGGAIARGFATAGLAGAVAVGAVVAPRVIEDRREDKPGTLVQPGADPATDPTPRSSASGGAPASETRTTEYRDRRIGFSLRYPTPWSRFGSGAIGANYIAFASDDDISRGYEMWQQSGKCDPCPVAVAVELKNFAENPEWVRLARSMVARLKREGVKVSESRVTIAGRSTVAFHLVWPDRAPKDPNDQEWCRGCTGDWFLVPWYENTTLDLRVMGLDAAAYRRDGAAALRLVRSVRDIGPPSERLMPKIPTHGDPKPSPAPTGDPGVDCTPRSNGSIKTTIMCDTATEAALRFAAARVNGKHAEDWLSASAKERYDKHDGGLWLYAPKSERAYRSYFITDRSDATDGTVRFTVEMNQGYVGDTGDRIRTEHVLVRAGDANWSGTPTENSMMVVDAELIAEPTEP